MVVTMIEENHERVLLVVNLVGNVDLWELSTMSASFALQRRWLPERRTLTHYGLSQGEQS